ncbi:DUF4236 domain-containing protein [Lacipirellula parvula]|uniref:DUF4236 domain-containing protein n=1 Tax=Lacipirellula parvula TaxID=2650471 RepID=A0A5K7XRJ2_9BACT|nr:DUF4236 domain-containing protein [Lacipirellula parvula]BBO36579.1 hypothetical protein PLANPX_6191 [Lacipirellula parvula]
MGFYIRQSVKVGPLRFNLSKSGIGVSAGIKGFRVGTGPRGNYVHIGAGGLYYRQTLPSAAPRRARESSADPDDAGRFAPPAHTHGPMEEVTSGCVSKMVDSNAAVLLAELDRKQKQWRAFPIAVTASIGLVGGLYFQGAPPWIVMALAAVVAIASGFAYYWDLLKKSVVVMYDLDEERLKVFEQLHDRLEGLSRSGALWHVFAQGDVYDRKYHAGASSLVQRRRISLTDQAPPFVRTNVPSYRFPAGSQELYFLPDTILVYGSAGVGAVSYENVILECSSTRFIESETVPHDAKVIDRTWQYVNKKGGPDRRFKANRELPICEYDELKFRSSSGLNELLQVSRCGLSAGVKLAVESMAATLKRARSAPKPPPPPIAAASVASSVRSADLPAVSETHELPGAANDIRESLFRILCCAMAVDGRASSIEKERIADLMRKAGAPWDADALTAKLAEFVDEVAQHGFKKVLAESLAALKSFRSAAQQQTLIRCIEYIVSSDGAINDAERAFIARVRSTLPQANASVPSRN